MTLSGNFRHNELKKAEEFDGYSCIFSTKNIIDKDMVRLYFDKDIVERAFRVLKGVINLNPVRHWLYNRVIAHVFICYLSYLLLSILKLNLKDIGITPVQAIKDLKSIYRVYFSNKKKNVTISKTVTLNKKQENILKAVDKKLLKDVRKCSDHF